LNILIINPPIRLSDKPRHIPHGLAIIANLLRKKTACKINFLDLNAHRYSETTVEKIIRETAVDVLLIGGLIPVYKRIIELSRIVRKHHPECVVIAGGSAAMSVPEMLLSDSDVDVVCACEGEPAIVELMDGLKRSPVNELTHIKGFYFKIEKKVRFSGDRELIKDLDKESDLPAYDMLPMDVYLKNPVVGFGKDIDFISSRGCPFQCTFCYQPWGRRFRGHSVGFIIEGLKLLKNNYDVDFISFQDDEFMAKPDRVHEFCEAVQSRIPGLLWSCTGRVNIVSDALVGTMRRAGCVCISYGFESGSPRMLKSMKKNASIEQMENAVKLNRRHGMLVPVSFIIGLPGENEESCRETVDFCIRNNLTLESLMFATPYPGTELFEFAVRTNRIPKENLRDYVLRLGDAREFTVNLTDSFSDRALIEKRMEMMAEVRSRIDVLSRQALCGKLRELFGDLVDDYLDEKDNMKHRDEHGGMNNF
jgi:radical SAM superfamily enzyme YgiQ (UPF0313 family)